MLTFQSEMSHNSILILHRFIRTANGAVIRSGRPPAGRSMAALASARLGGSSGNSFPFPYPVSRSHDPRGRLPLGEIASRL